MVRLLWFALLCALPFCVHAQQAGLIVGPGGGGSSGSGSSISITASTPTVIVNPSPGTSGAITIGTTAPNRTVTTSPTIGSGDLGGQINMNVSGGGTLTVPATSTFGNGATVSVVNYSASTAAVTTTPTINAGGGCVTATGIPGGFSWQMTSNGTSIDCIQTAPGGPTPLTSGSSTGNTLSGPRQYFICTAACTVTPPVPPATGAFEFCVQNDVAVTSVITMGAIGSSVRYGKTDQSAYGTAGTGTFISGGAAGDKICLLSKDATHYNTASFNGTWTAN